MLGILLILFALDRYNLGLVLYGIFQALGNFFIYISFENLNFDLNIEFTFLGLALVFLGLSYVVLLYLSYSGIKKKVKKDLNE